VRRSQRAALTYFGAVFAAGFVLGVIRVGLLVPRLGTRTSELIEMPFMVLACLVAARWIFRRRDLRTSERLTSGGSALALLLAAEFGLAYLLRGQAPMTALLDRDPVSGAAYFAALLLFALMPLLVGRRTPLS